MPRASRCLARVKAGHLLPNAGFTLGLFIGDREASADCQRGKLIDPIAPGAPVRKLLFVEAPGDACGSVGHGARGAGRQGMATAARRPGL